MAWIFATVVLLLVVFVPRFRVFAVWALGVLLLIVLGVWLYISWSDSRAESLVGISEVALEDVRLRASAVSWVLSGRVRNNSTRHTLTGITFDLIIKDCIGGGPMAGSDDPQGIIDQIDHKLLLAPARPTLPSSQKCDVVGQEQSAISHLVVPPGQVRNFEESIFFSSGTKVKNNMEWNYKVLKVSGK